MVMPAVLMSAFVMPPAATIVVTIIIIVIPAVISVVTGFSVVPSVLCLCGIGRSKKEHQEEDLFHSLLVLD